MFDDILAQVKKDRLASSGTAGDDELEVILDYAQTNDVFLFISDEILIGCDDFESQFWMRGKFKAIS